jgi:predicted ferric reductase
MQGFSTIFAEKVDLGVRVILILLYLAIPLGPLLIVLGAGLPHELAGRPWRDDFASALAMSGLAILFLEFVVIGRYRTLSHRFGCDVIMRTHQLFARTATFFVVLHPFLYSLWPTMGTTAAAKGPTAQALGLSAGSLFTGFLAWMAVLALVFLAIRRHAPDTDYDRWRFWHLVLGLLVIGFGLHHTLHAGLYASLPVVTAFWWILAATAVFSMVFIHVLRPLAQRARPYRCDAVIQRAERTWELVLSAVATPVAVPQPGQFFWLKRGSPWGQQDHPFSVAGQTDDGKTIRFLIKVAGDFTAAIPGATAGELFYLDGPSGEFRVPQNAKTIVLVAGGIGLAPFLGVLSDLARKKDARRIVLIQATGAPALQVEPRAFTDTDALPAFELVPIVEQADASWSGRVGRCDGPRLLAILSELGVSASDPDLAVMVCGPNPMIASIEKALIEGGLAMRQLRSERYQYDLDLTSPVSRRQNFQWLVLSVLMLVMLGVLAYFVGGMAHNPASL